MVQVFINSDRGAAGFANVDSEEINITAEVDENFIQDAFTLEPVPEEHKATARHLITEHKESFRVGDVYRIQLPMLVIRAEKPTA